MPGLIRYELLRALLGGLAGGGATAYAARNQEMTPMSRALWIGENAATGAAVGAFPKQTYQTFKSHPGLTIAGLTATEATPSVLNTLALSNNQRVYQTELIKRQLAESQMAPSPPAQSGAEPFSVSKFISNHPVLSGAAAAAGLGLTYLGYQGARALKQVANNETSPGTVRVTLPRQSDKDHETEVELPLERLALSRNLYHGIARDTRRRLRQETQARVLHRPTLLNQ